ncbi:molecular chaperone HtpG [Lachnospiraceae bacterium XPB1003]|nr:molecular chaperone HtpG [Lachnospiraceae bacterium XPB1003]
MANKGSLSISSENIFPIIKKWMYSDQDIFFRELVSNGSDAITKLKKLDMMGEYSLPEGYKGKIEVIVSPENKTIKVIDNGLGMTEDEVSEYINQIAFSGATDFIEKYKDKANEDQIIGHFGLGFYSAFMIADQVEINTLSYKEGAKAVHWTCDGGTDYEMEDGNRTEIGTEIILHVSSDCEKYCNKYEAEDVLRKYCSFMPYEIFISKEGEELTETIKVSEKLDTDVVLEEIPGEYPKDKDGKEDTSKEKSEDKLKIKKRPVALNDTTPLWAKHPNECTKDEYLEFYRKVFHDYKEPLFWIHLNMDYPFNLKGILYFPKINMEFESIEGVIKLYNNQVFIADNIKEVIPEYLMLLKGVIDCPDLPLNVSRSALQNDGFVKKISDYISKKVADKLAGMCKTERDEYDKYWDDISPFIKYGCLKDDKFCEKMTDYILFKDIDGKYMSLPECLEVKPIDTGDEEGESATDADGNKVEAEVVEKEETSDNTEEEKKDKKIYYVTDEQQQSQYINMFRKAGKIAVVLKDTIDQPFLQQLETKNEGIHFLRIDSELTDDLKAKNSKKVEEELGEQTKVLEKIFKKVIKKDNVTVKAEKLKNKDISSMLTISEEARRMQDMMKMYATRGLDMGSMPKQGQTLILNTNNKLVQKILEDKESENADLLFEQLYDLARIQNEPLDPEAMTKFVARTNKLLSLLA